MSILSEEFARPDALLSSKGTRVARSMRRHPLRYRMAVIATDQLEAVVYSGGWLFDQSMAGWDVSVHVLEDGPTLPLSILGASVISARSSRDDPSDHLRPPRSWVLSANLFRTDQRIRATVTAAMGRNQADIRLWGHGFTDDLEHQTVPARHHLSNAARAFKRRALEAAGMPGDLAQSVEELCRVGPASIDLDTPPRSTITHPTR